MLIELFIGQMLLICFNIGNAHHDAYRIMKNKTIAHALNFAAYLVFSVLVCILFKIHFRFDLVFGFIPIVYGPGLLFLISAFLNRQLSFDVALNLRRGLDWYYQTKATGPKASVLDRIERLFFGQGESVGKLIFSFYAGSYIGVIISFIIAYA